MNNDKPLRDMSTDEIASLSPDVFQDLAHDHNDYLELRENAYERVIADSKDPANYPDQQIDRRAASRLPDPDAEVDRLLDKLVNHDRKKDSFLQSIIEAATGRGPAPEPKNEALVTKASAKRSRSRKRTKENW